MLEIDRPKRHDLIFWFGVLIYFSSNEKSRYFDNHSVLGFLCAPFYEKLGSEKNVTLLFEDKNAVKQNKKMSDGTQQEQKKVR